MTWVPQVLAGTVVCTGGALLATGVAQDYLTSYDLETRASEDFVEVLHEAAEKNEWVMDVQGKYATMKPCSLSKRVPLFGYVERDIWPRLDHSALVDKASSCLENLKKNPRVDPATTEKVQRLAESLRLYAKTQISPWTWWRQTPFLELASQADAWAQSQG